MHAANALRCRRPAKGRGVVFADAAGIVIIGGVLGLSAQGWRIGQFHGEPRYTIRRLSGGWWRTAWRVVAVYLTAASGAFYEAIALGLYERTRHPACDWRQRAECRRRCRTT